MRGLTPEERAVLLVGDDDICNWPSVEVIDRLAERGVVSARQTAEYEREWERTELGALALRVDAAVGRAG